MSAHTCASFVVALDADATLENNREWPRWVLEYLPRGRRDAPSGKTDRGLFFAGQCVATGGNMRLRIRPSGVGDDAADTPLGTGRAVVYAYLRRPEPAIWQKACVRCSRAGGQCDRDCLWKDELTEDICR
jgi:hypothetical protein